MYFGRSRTASALIIALTCFSGGFVRSDDAPAAKYRLKEASSAVGDSSIAEKVTSMSMNMEVTMHGPDGERTLDPLPVGFREREKYSETVLGVVRDKTTSLRRSYSIARTQDSNPGEKPTTTTHARQGKTFTVRWQNGTPTITTAAGKIAPAELKSLKEEFMDNSDVHIFPDEEVAVGSEWTVDPKYLSKSFKGAERATMKAKLEEVAPFQGHPCARITLTIEMYGTFGGVPMLMELAGEMRHAIDIQHTTSIIMSGPVSMKMEKTENGIPLSIQGKGDFAGTWTRQYTKLGSKPASAQ